MHMPTANINPSHPKKLIPGDGVYSGLAYVDSETYLAAISIGNRPTFESPDRALEAHLIDFDDDLYHRTLTLEFKQKIRDQIAFTSHQDLTLQMQSDVKSIKEMIAVQTHIL